MQRNHWLAAVSFFFALLLAGVAPAAAQTTAIPNTIQSLGGITTFQLLSEEIANNECGITSDDILSTLTAALTPSRIKTVPQANSLIYVNVNVFNSCSAAHVVLQINTVATLRENGKVRFGATVWSKSFLLGGSSDMNRRAKTAVENLTKQLIADWSSVNQ